MTFSSTQKVRFGHVDAAGIVFYPRYFEMLNAAVEDYFEQVIETDFKSIHLDRGLGIPTVKLDSEFMAPSRLGDLLDFHVDVARVGRSSAELAIEVRCSDELRFRSTVVLVCMDLKTGHSFPWPDDIRPREPVPAG